MTENRIGAAIKAKREEFGYSQEELAEKIGKTSSFIGQLERGDALPSVKTLASLTHILAIDANEYFYDKNVAHPESHSFSLMIEQLDPDMRSMTTEVVRQIYKYGR